MRVRKAIAALSTIGFAVLGTTVTAPAAHAGGYGCSGTETSWSAAYGGSGYPVPGNDGSTVGHIHEYFDGTYNCAVFLKSTYAGTKTETALGIMAQNGNFNTAPGTDWLDVGWYYTYAGPVTINGSGTCVREEATLYDPAHNLLADWTSPWHSCG